MGGLVVIAIIVIGYIMYKDYEQDKQDKLRKQKESQEAATRLNFEQELRRKAAQWFNNPFFLNLANYTTIKISDHINSAISYKIGRGEKDIYNIFCKNSYIEIRENGSYTRSTTYHYREMGFDNLSYDSTTIARVCSHKGECDILKKWNYKKSNTSR